MRDSQHVEKYRIRRGPLASDSSLGMNGAFYIPSPLGGVYKLTVVASDGADVIPWEHVSVSRRDCCPTWVEMDFIKRLFWWDDETVLQFHVPVDQHINIHEHCLHLWRPVGRVVELPPEICV